MSKQYHNGYEHPPSLTALGTQDSQLDEQSYNQPPPTENVIRREGCVHRLQSPMPDKNAIIEALCDIYDPEIPVNIYDLGLIYSIELSDRDIAINMTLTAPGCPVAASLPGEVADQVASIDGVSKVEVSLVWDPPWTLEYMSDDARLALGMV